MSNFMFILKSDYICEFPFSKGTFGLLLEVATVWVTVICLPFLLR